MKQAEILGLDIFMIAMKAGVGLYKRLGFRIEKEIVQDDSKYGGESEYYQYFMIYEQDPRSNV
jgi:ribosomal protein S18 acetylase RimI-like enzyme